MEHIMQVAFEFDDEAIKRRVIENGFNTICEGIKDDILKQIFESRSYYGKVNPNRDPLSDLSANIIRETLNEHKDDIIEKAAKIVADSIKRSRSYKDYIKKIGEEA